MKNSSKFVITRSLSKTQKHVLNMATVVWTMAAFVAPSVHAQVSSAPIKIGVVSAKQGVFAESGVAAANGARLALEQAGSKVLGRTIDLLWYDEPNPQAAQQNMTKLIEEDKVSLVVGGSNSASALAMASVAKRAKVPLIVTAGAAREITGKECNRYTFRTQLTVPVGARALAPVLLEQGKKWYFLSASYALGQDIYGSMKSALQQAGGEELGYDPVPVGTTDFSSFLLKVRQKNPSAIVAGMGGNDLNNLLKQMAEFGMKDRIAVASTVVTDLAMWSVGSEAAAGIYAKHWHYSNATNSTEEKQFISAWQSKYGKPPAVEAWQGWMSMRMALAAIEQAKSTNGPAVVKALETLKLGGSSLPAYYREWDHQFVHPVLIVKGRAPTATDKWDMFELVRKVPANAGELDALYGSKAEVGCTLGEL